MRDEGFATASDGCRLFYRSTGPADGPTIVFANSLGTTLEMWDAQAAAFGADHRVLRYDSRGHGRSAVPAGPYTIDRLGDDLIAVLDHCGAQRVSFCGLSLGGMVGQNVGARYGERFERLVLANTAAKMGTPQSWGERIATVLSAGMSALRPAILERWFTPEFVRAEPAEVARIGAMLDASDARGYAASCAAIRDMDARPTLPAIRVPTLVIVGSRDPATPPADGEYIATRIPGARSAVLAAAHLSNVEQAAQFSAAVRAFVSELV